MSYLSGVTHFYLMNDIELNRKKLAAFLGEATRAVEESPYTKNEIRQLIRLCDSIAKTLLHTEDEEIWVLLQFFKDQNHWGEVRKGVAR